MFVQPRSGSRHAAGWRTMARIATTIARTPRPSANAAPRMNWARICGVASGFRPIAVAARPVRMPMPMPGPMTPSAARPAPMNSTVVSLHLAPREHPAVASFLPGWPAVRLVVVRLVAARAHAGERRRDVAFGDVGKLGGRVLLIAVAFDRDDR